MTSSPAFTLFPKLPLELRRKIWQSALPDARTITLKTQLCQTDTDETAIQLINTTLPTPTVFHVSQESRREAFMLYQQGFYSFQENSNGKCAYIDFDADIVYCGFHMPMTVKETNTRPSLSRKLSITPEDALSPLDTLVLQEGHHIKRLAIHFGSPFSPYFTVDVNKPIEKIIPSLLQMRCLEEVTLVWMEESSPSNYLIGGTGKKDAMLDDEDWEKDYIEDVEKAAENLQKVLNDAEAQRIKWKAPVVKVLMDL